MLNRMQNDKTLTGMQALDYSCSVHQVSTTQNAHDVRVQVLQVHRS